MVSRVMRPIGRFPPVTLRGVLLVVAVVGSVGVQIQAMVFSHPALAVTLAFVVLFVFPGFLLTTLLFKPSELSWLQLLAVSSVLGVGTLIVPATLLLLLRTSLDHLVWVSIGINGGLVLLHIFWPRARRWGGRRILENRGAVRTNLLLVGACFVAVVLTLVLFNSLADIYAYGDRWGYTAYMRQYLDWPRLDFSDPMYEASRENQFRVMFDGWLVLEALLSKVSGVDPIAVFSLYLPPLLMVVSLLAFFSLAKELFRDPNIALLSSLVLILDLVASMRMGHGFEAGFRFFGSIAQDKHAAWLVFAPVAFMMLLRYLRQGSLRHLTALGLGAATLAFTHPLGISFFAICFVSFALFHVYFNLRWGTIVRLAVILALIVVLLSVPLLGKVAAQRTGTTHSLYVKELIAQPRVAKSHDLRLLDGGRYVADARILELDRLMIVALWLTPFLLWRLRWSLAAQFLFSTMVVPLALIFNPITASWLGWLIGPLFISRMVWLCPVALVVGFYFYSCTRVVQRWLRERLLFTRRSLLLQMVPVVLLVLVGLLLRGDIKASADSFGEMMSYTVSEDDQAVIDYLSGHLTADSTIMVEYPMSYQLPAYSTRANVVPTPYNPAVDRFFNAKLFERTMIDALHYYGARYVIVKADSSLVWQLKSLPRMFSRIYHNETYEIYKVASVLQPNRIITANTHFVHREWDKAVVEYEAVLLERVVAVSPEDAWLYFYLGQGYANLAETAELDARTFLQKAAEAYWRSWTLDVQNTTTLDELLKACEGLDDWCQQAGVVDGVLAHLEKAAELDAGDGELLVGLARWYLVGGRYEEAAVTYLRATKLRPRDADVHISLGAVYLAQHRLDDAATAFERAIELEPMEGHMNVAQLYEREGWTDKALVHYQAAGERYQAAADAADGRVKVVLLGKVGQVYEAQGQLDKAVTQYLTAVQATDDSGTMRDLYGRAADLYLATGDLEAARSLTRSVLWNERQNAGSWSLAMHVYPALIEWYEAQGDVARARAMAWEFFAIAPRHKAALQALTCYDFIANFDSAEVEAPEEPFPHVRLTEFTLPDTWDQREVLFMFPEARVSYRFEVPSEPSALWFSLAMNPETWGLSGDGSTFEVYVTDEGGASRLLFSEHVGNGPEGQKWHDRELSLALYAGQEVTLAFVTQPGPGGDFTNDEAGWGTPRVIWARLEERDFWNFTEEEISAADTLKNSPELFTTLYPLD
jgi:tetratricopeptide (TPR) repeat protein